MTITTNIGDRKPVGILCQGGEILSDLREITLADGRVVYECGDTNIKADERVYVDPEGIIVGGGGV